MPDREKVIRGLECCIGQCNYHGCPYKDPCENANGVKSIMADALVMLKEQQQQIWEFQDQVEYLTDKLKEQEAVVRCKDCMHKNYCSIHDAKYLDEWFCADGERKEGR